MKEKHGKLKDEHILHRKNGINSGAGKLFVSYFFLYMISITKLTTTKNARIIGSYLRSLCKLVTDQWRGSLGVRDSESCWFTKEIGTYMRCWERPGDLPLVIEIVVSFRSFRCAPLEKRHNISITRGRSPGLSQERR
jgi:hypothetical protein